MREQDSRHSGSVFITMADVLALYWPKPVYSGVFPSDIPKGIAASSRQHLWRPSSHLLVSVFSRCFAYRYCFVLSLQVMVYNNITTQCLEA